MSPISTLRRFVQGNSGRQYRVVAAITPHGGRVRTPVASAQGVHLQSCSDSLTPAAARAHGLALIEAATLAEHMEREHAAQAAVAAELGHPRRAVGRIGRVR